MSNTDKNLARKWGLYTLRFYSLFLEIEIISVSLFHSHTPFQKVHFIKVINIYRRK